MSFDSQLTNLSLGGAKQRSNPQTAAHAGSLHSALARLGRDDEKKARCILIHLRVKWAAMTAHHHHGHPASLRIFFIAIVLTALYAGIEAGTGWYTGSLALLGDAGHMASDALALGIAAFATWISAKPPSHQHSYGFGRAEVIAAWVSSVMMLIISAAIMIEAIHRMEAPTSVKGGPVMLIAFLGILMNLFIAWILSGKAHTLNSRAALLHVMGDVLGAGAALISGAVIYFTGWLPIDPTLSLFIGVLIMLSSIRLLRESMSVLMEGVPHHLDLKQVSDTMTQIEGVNAIHDLHIWTLSSGKIALSAHIDLHDLIAWEKILTNVKITLNKNYCIQHITLQPEVSLTDCEPCYKLQ